jgi:hypothetical protein
MLALALALIVGGCGGEATSAPAVPKATFMTKAEAACLRAYNHIKKELHAHERRREGRKATTAELNEYAETVIVPTRKRELEDLRAIGPPEGEEGLYTEILAAYEEGIRATEEDPKKALFSLFGAFVKAQELTEKLGLKTCR